MRRLGVGVAVLGLGIMMLPRPTLSFVVGKAPSVSLNRGHSGSSARFAVTTSMGETTAATSSTGASMPPSWEELTARLNELTPKEEESKKEPLVTLYRDTNGWCPFCERVWIALEYKGIPYRERLIDLRDKPEWFKELVPTTLVPALLFHSDTPDKPERRVVWESMDILSELDEAFPDTPSLVIKDDDAAYDASMELQTQVARAGLSFQFASRNATVTDEERLERRAAFEESLNKLDAALGASQGPFLLGHRFSAVDLVMIPMMERWRHQLPVTVSLDILQNRPHLQQWFSHLETNCPFYSRRVAGDEYSWVAVAATFMRYFSADTTVPQVAQAIAKSLEAADRLTKSFSSLPSPSEEAAASWAAAAKLVSNHEAVAYDCTNPEPKSQQEVPRASNPQVADVLIRHVVSLLLEMEEKTSGGLAMDTADERADAARAARTIAARLCVPRDMGAPSRYGCSLCQRVAGRLVESGRSVGSKVTCVSLQKTLTKKDLEKERNQRLAVIATHCA